jgi:hypothetical protein
VAASAAESSGAESRAIELYDLALQLDPGVIRRQDLSLPVRMQSNQRQASADPLAREAMKMLRRSPRFHASKGGFPLRIESDGSSATACLLGLKEERLSCVEVSPRAGEGIRDRARRLVAELHRQAFAPKIDLTQSDLQSLDGSPTAGGGRSAERLQNVLNDLLGDETSH